MKRFLAIAAVAVCIASLSAAAWAYVRVSSAGVDMTQAAKDYLGALDKAQLEKSQLTYDSPKRVDWHFIPKDTRKGLQIKEMNETQRKLALALLNSCLSKVGYDKATHIMNLENVLHQLEANKTGAPLRDPHRYYFTVFGKPGETDRWGLSIEGHHLSLNFVVEGDQVISSTPAVFATNPAVVMTETSTDVKTGTRILADEELVAFELLKSLTPEQRGIAIIDPTAPKEVRGAGEGQPPVELPVGLAAEKMTKEQVNLLRRLVEVYANNMPSDVAHARMDAIERGGPAKIHFAWAGADRPGVGHYYRIQGPSFVIEFVNTQPDAAGNPANHIHCMWRDMKGDFALPIKVQ